MSAEEHFPAMRGGADVGPVLLRDGDYVGATVVEIQELRLEETADRVPLIDPVETALN